MAKFFAPPEFKSIDDVFAVLSDPKRVLKALAEMRDMLNAINLRLGDLDTHEKVEASVATANILMQEVQAAKHKAVEAVEAATATAAKLIDDATAKAAGVLEDARMTDAKRKSELKAVQDREKRLNEIEAALVVRENANSALSDDLARRQAEIVSREKELADKAKRIAAAVAG